MLPAAGVIKVITWRPHDAQFPDELQEILYVTQACGIAIGGKRGPHHRMHLANLRDLIQGRQVHFRQQHIRRKRV